MDGAIVLSGDFKKILYANAQLIPSHEIITSETGTRHRTAERTAKQTGELVISISQRRNIITIFKGNDRYILENTDNNIMLVPHVMKGADLSTLKVLYNNFKENDRVYLVEDENLNAKQLKYLISNCRMFIGARTHATIAAYSTKVPTLVLGYSVKSRGIAKDLFGTDEKYVLPVSDLKSDDYLVNGFKWLAENEEKIKNTLEDKMPNYIEQIKSIKEIIK